MELAAEKDFETLLKETPTADYEPNLARVSLSSSSTFSLETNAKNGYAQVNCTES
jgi:hypothetical protein